MANKKTTSTSKRSSGNKKQTSRRDKDANVLEQSWESVKDATKQVTKGAKNALNMDDKRSRKRS